MAEGRTETVGRDVVRFRGSAVVVESAADMPDWEFRDYRRTALLFRGQQYFVAEKRLLPEGSYRYVLEPWVGGVDVPGRTITYDEGYASARDADAGDGKRRDRASAALAVFVDMVMRTSPADGGEQEQPGFWEWARPGWKRRARR